MGVFDDSADRGSQPDLSAEPSANTPREPSRSAGASGPPSLRPRRKLLLADRAHGLREQLAPVLRRLGAEIVEATSGEQAETLARSQEPFDLVITNAQLPSLSGLQVLARARAHGVPSPFIVVASVHDTLVRVFVSEATGAVLSSRVVDLENLAELASGLMKSVPATS